MAKRGSHGIVEEKGRRKGRKQNTPKPARRQRIQEKPQQKSKGKGIIIAVAIIAVIIAGAVGTFLYIYVLPNQKTDNSENTTQVTTTAIHETLVVVTVTDETITYNGEEIASALELERRISQEENPTLSLVNIGADIDTYNAVATVLNKYGGSYEMMDKKNTNPSIAETTTTV